MKKMWYYKVDDCQQENTIDEVLREVLGLSKRQVSQVKFREQGICVNGTRRRISYRLKKGDMLAVCLEDEGGSSQIESASGRPRIVYEDEDLIVMDKESGQVCHPVGGHYRDSLANQLAAYCRDRQEESVIRIIGRLDRDTSGLVAAAKNQIAAQRLARQRERGEMGKEYWALIHGSLPQTEGVIRLPVSKVQEHPLKMGTGESGKPASTVYEVIKSKGNFSLVRCFLHTGRTHQIRVHMSSLGHPLVNDCIYGSGDEDRFPQWLEMRKKVQGDRHRKLGLHAGRLWLRQPFSGKPIELTSDCEFWDWLT